MFLSNFGGDLVTQLKLTNVNFFNEVAPSSERDLNLTCDSKFTAIPA